MKNKCKILVKKSSYEILEIYNTSHSFPTHIHKKICVGKVNSGEKYLNINGNTEILRKNDIFYIPAFVPHSCYVKEGTITSYTVLSIDDINKISEETIINDIATTSIGVRDISSLYRYAIKKDDNYYCTDKIISKLLQYIDDNYAEPLSADFLAELIDINPYYLLHIFKEKIGLSLHQYIIQTRIKKTKEYFTQQKNILDIALTCGFYDQSHYIKHFKKHVGITPRQYFDSVTII